MLFCSAGRGGGLATCGVSASGGRGRGFAAPGAGLTSIAGGSGATCCWLVTGAGGFTKGGVAGGRGAAAFGFRGSRRRSRPGSGTGVKSSLGGFASSDDVGTSAGGGSKIGAGAGGGGSPRSMASSLRVSWSIARTASQDDKAATSTLRLSASGVPAANN